MVESLGGQLEVVDEPSAISGALGWGVSLHRTPSLPPLSLAGGSSRVRVLRMCFVSALCALRFSFLAAEEVGSDVEAAKRQLEDILSLFSEEEEQPADGDGEGEGGGDGDAPAPGRADGGSSSGGGGESSGGGSGNPPPSSSPPGGG